MEQVQQLEAQLAQLARQQAALKAQLRVARRAVGVREKRRRITEQHLANAHAMRCSVPESLRYTIPQIAHMMGIGERALQLRLKAVSRPQTQPPQQQQQQSVETPAVTTPLARKGHDLNA